MRRIFNFIIMVEVVCLLLNILEFRRPIVAPSETFASDEIPSAEYLEALRTTNAFLWAWIMRDYQTGNGLISDKLRRKVNDDTWLKQFIVGLSNPQHQAFLIENGRKLQDGRFMFSVILYELYFGEDKGSVYRGFLEVVKQGNVWRVDRLPKSSDNP